MTFRHKLQSVPRCDVPTRSNVIGHQMSRSDAIALSRLCSHSTVLRSRADWRTAICTVCFLLTFFGMTAVPARADLVKLMNGGELRGKVITQKDGRNQIRLETVTGATVIVDRDQTQFVTMRSAVVEEYETKARRIEDEWERHWELSEWCRQHALPKQREVHLRRVTELSPDHEKAQLALGRVWNKGAWVDRDELMTAQGYVKYKNKYITPQELEIIEKTADELQRERGWFQKIRAWHGWLTGMNADRHRKALDEFQTLDDPNAATAIIKFLSDDPHIEVRRICVSVLIKISGHKAATGLIKIALFDMAPEVRELAREGIGREYYDQAQNSFIQALRSEYNVVVCRAAMALGEIGDKKAVGPLIDALITAHLYQVTSDIPSQPTYSFTTDGGFGPNGTAIPAHVLAAVRTGQMNPPIIAPSGDQLPKKTVTVRVEHQNSEVLDALEKLTQQNFGYDKRTWGLWWAAEKNVGGKLPK